MGPGLGGGSGCPMSSAGTSFRSGGGVALALLGGLGLPPRGDPRLSQMQSGSPHPQKGGTAMQAPGCFGARSACFVCRREASPHC